MSACCEKRQCLKTQTKPPEHNNWPGSMSQPCSQAVPAPGASPASIPARPAVPGARAGIVSIKPWGLSWSREAPRVQLGWNTMFKTILWDPAGASALVQRQPDGNEVERAAQRWGMGNPFPLHGGENNSDSEIHIHMYQQGSMRALMGMLAVSSCQRDVTCALCGIEETGQRRRGESLCHCTRAGWTPQNQSRICSLPLSFSSSCE